jgi:hypothetical protein
VAAAPRSPFGGPRGIRLGGRLLFKTKGSTEQ